MVQGVLILLGVPLWLDEEVVLLDVDVLVKELIRHHTIGGDRFNRVLIAQGLSRIEHLCDRIDLLLPLVILSRVAVRFLVTQEAIRE